MTAPSSPTTEISADAKLRELLDPILARVSALEPAQRRGTAVTELEAILEAEFPYHGEHVQAIGGEIQRGVREGWLCNRGPQEARFSRLAKASATTYELSIDCVSMHGKAIEHTHPQGEVTIGFPAEGAAQAALSFDGRPCGWVFMPAGTRHIPTVRGGTMNLIYFLPQGAVEWHVAAST